MSTKQNVMESMGSAATDEEAEAMMEILDEREIENLDDISDEEFFALIPLAVSPTRKTESAAMN